jgi:hypothetical protein
VKERGAAGPDLPGLAGRPGTDQASYRWTDLLYLDRFKGGRSTLSPVRIAIDSNLLPFKGIPGFDKLLRKHA